MSIPNDKFFKDFSLIGNTVSSTIPISLINCNKKILNQEKPIMLLGFGVGYSLSGGVFHFDKR